MSNAADLVREMRDALIDVAERLAIHMTHTEDLVAHMRAHRVINEADSYLKEGAEAVKYGCHWPRDVWPNVPVEEDCIKGGCDNFSGSTDDCQYWRPIK